MNREQFSEMTTKQKLKWFFDYYGLTVVISVICICVACVFIKPIFWPEKIDDICVLIYSDNVSKEQCIEYEKEIESTTGKTVSVQVYNVSDPYGSQALAAKIGCDVVDLVIASKNEMELMSESGYLLSYGIIEGSSMYMGIPCSSRKSEALEETVKYFNGIFGN